MSDLKYVVLAGLSIEPRSGYALTRWMERAGHNFWAADHSSIYPTLTALEREGSVTHTLAPSQRGPQQKIYTVTPAGLTALIAWVQSPVAAPEVHDEQMVKALCYDLIPVEQALTQIHTTRAYHAQKLHEYQAALALLDELAQSASGQYNRLGPRLTLLHGIVVEQGYLTWCEQAEGLLRPPGNS